MTLRLMSALCILLLAGCTSSEPQNVSYAPLAAQPPVVRATPAVTHAAPVAMPAAPLAVEPQSQPAGLLPAKAAGLPSTEATGFPQADAAMLPPGATNCSTVDGVTLCDAPFDPVVDATQHTN